MARYDPSVTVCSRCFRACCWQGEFMCDDAAAAAGIVERRISSLIRRHGESEIEHPEWWNNDLRTKNKTPLTADDIRALGLSEPELLEISDSPV